MPEYFPDLIHCRCLMSQYELPSIEGLSYRVGLLEGARVGIHALAGFPSLHTLPYRGHLEQAGVTVFQQASKNDSMVITLQNLYDGRKTEDIGHEKIGNKIFFGWPYLREGKVLAVSDNLFRYEYDSVGDGTKLVPISHGPAQLAEFERNSTGIEENYSNGHQENKLDIQILTLKVKESLDFAKDIVKKSESEKPYFPSYTVATLVNLKPLPLSKIMSSFTVVVNGDTRLNLGLSLKFEARRQKVLGYSRRVSEGWQFSDKALALVKEFKTKFPEFIAGLTRNPHKGIFTLK